MKWTCLLVLAWMPTLLMAQIDRDGKSPTVEVSTTNSHLLSNSILLSGSTAAPFGIKYLYCESFGGYASCKTDFGLIYQNLFISAGVAKSIGKKLITYIGGGINVGSGEYDYYYTDRPSPLGEFGLIIKVGRVALDIGMGIEGVINYWYDGQIADNYYASFSGIVGIGFRF